MRRRPDKIGVEPARAVPDAAPSRRSLRALDWLNFFVADVRTGVGPFVAMRLAELGWGSRDVGIALTAAELAGVLTQAPGGALVDAVRAKRLLLTIGVVALVGGALVLAFRPTYAVVMAAQAALGCTGSVLGPGIGAVTLGLVGYRALAARTGRNGAFGSAGNIVAALSMGLVGAFVSVRAIFFVVAALSLPTLATIALIRGREVDPARARGAAADASVIGLRALFADRRLAVFGACIVLWHLANGSMLPLLGEMMVGRHARSPALFMGAFTAIPQLVMALQAPFVARLADRVGRKPLLVVSFATLAARCALCAWLRAPWALMAQQLLDGVAAGVFGVVGFLVIADLTRGTGRFNVAGGMAGAAVGVGASISTTVSGEIVERWGYGAGFLALAGAAVAALATLIIAMPETHHPDAVAPSPA